MKKLIYKPIALMGIFSISLFGCAGSTETETAENTGTDAPVVEEPVVVTQTEPMADAGSTEYADLFDNVNETESYDILALARMEEDLSTFVELVELADMETAFQVQDKMTLLAPINEAFQRMSVEELQKLKDPQNRPDLVKFLNNHIISSEVPVIQFSSNKVISTQGQENIPVTTEAQGEFVYIGGAAVIKEDVEASNGYIHVVDNIVQPGKVSSITVD